MGKRTDIKAGAPDIVAAPDPQPLRRAGSRRAEVLATAARLFVQRGFDATSMRDIAEAVGMQPGSLYSHFRSKDALFLAVYQTGIQQSIERVQEYAAAHDDAWSRLVAASEAHIEMMVDGGTFAAVVMNWPNRADSVRQQVVAERDRYQSVFVSFIDALPIARGVDRHYLRLGILGAVNWPQKWYRPDGDPPAMIARRLLELFRGNLAEQPAGRTRRTRDRAPG